MRTPLVRPSAREHAAPFERLKQQLETADCDTAVFWRSELRRLAPTLAPDETVELIVPARFEDGPALAVVTDERLIAVSEAKLECVAHGTTVQLAARTDWAGDFKLTFTRETGTIELTDISEDDARRLYARLRFANRAPAVTADAKRRSKLEAPEKKDAFGAGMFPDPTRGLDLMRRRWLLKSVDETGPHRRSIAYVAHSLFYGTAVAVALAVGLFVVLLVGAIIAVLVYGLAAG